MYSMWISMSSLKADNHEKFEMAIILKVYRLQNGDIQLLLQWERRYECPVPGKVLQVASRYVMLSCCVT